MVHYGDDKNSQYDSVAIVICPLRVPLSSSLASSSSPLPYGSNVAADRRFAYTTAAVERHALDAADFSTEDWQ